MGLIFGGYAGHGKRTRVVVTPDGTRTCEDCNFSWSARDDEKTRTQTTCFATKPEPATKEEVHV